MTYRFEPDAPLIDAVRAKYHLPKSKLSIGMMTPEQKIAVQHKEAFRSFQNRVPRLSTKRVLQTEQAVGQDGLKVLKNIGKFCLSLFRHI